MNCCIIDTNVFIKAALGIASIDTDIDSKCIKACANFIDECRYNSEIVLVLDCRGEMIKEYEKHLNSKGKRTLSTELFIWVCQLAKRDYVVINKNQERGYDEFLTNDDLVGFDMSDRKFVAVAKAHAENPPIYQGSDSRWLQFRNALHEEGVTVKFLCEEYVENKYERKIR